MTGPEQIKQTVDAAIVISGGSSPWWLVYLTQAGAVLMWAALFTLAVVRAAIAIREWRQEKNPSNDS